MRHLVAFFVIGTALFFVKERLFARARTEPLLVVNVPRTASEADVERAIDEALLTDLALSELSVKSDPVVRDQLLKAMRGARDPHDTDTELLERAFALGVHRVDPVVRQRLAFQGEQLLRARTRLDEPSDSELTRYMEAHRERYREPARASFQQVFLSKSRRKERLEDDAREVLAKLSRAELSGAELRALSDPTILPLTLTKVSAREIDARFGPKVGEAVFASPVAAWSGPIRSPYGLHFVRIRELVPAFMPTLDTVWARVRADYLHDLSRARVSAELRKLRARYRIDVRRSGA